MKTSWLITALVVGIGLYFLAHIASWAVRVSEQVQGGLG